MSHAVLFENLKQNIKTGNFGHPPKEDASDILRIMNLSLDFFYFIFLYHLGLKKSIQAIFSFVPEGASSAHLVLGQVPHYAIKPGTLVWTDAESLHGGANGTTWGGLVSHYNPPKTNIAPEKWWLEDEFPFGFRPIFRCEVLVLGRKWGNFKIMDVGCLELDVGCLELVSHRNSF